MFCSAHACCRSTDSWPTGVFKLAGMTGAQAGACHASGPQTQAGASTGRLLQARARARTSRLVTSVTPDWKPTTLSRRPSTIALRCRATPWARHARRSAAPRPQATGSARRGGLLSLRLCMVWVCSGALDSTHRVDMGCRRAPLACLGREATSLQSHGFTTRFTGSGGPPQERPRARCARRTPKPRLGAARGRDERAWPCRYLASASPCAAMTTCSFSASAFSTAATLGAPAQPRQRPAAAWACAAGGPTQARRCTQRAQRAHVTARCCMPRVCRRPARVVRARSSLSRLRHVLQVSHGSSSALPESRMLGALPVLCLGTHLRRCAALISFIAARTFRSGSMSAHGGSRTSWQHAQRGAVPLRTIYSLPQPACCCST
jgi:hypothetical protein